MLSIIVFLFSIAVYIIAIVQMKHEYLLFGLAFNKQTIEQATATPVFSPNSSGKKK